MRCEACAVAAGLLAELPWRGADDSTERGAEAVVSVDQRLGTEMFDRAVAHRPKDAESRLLPRLEERGDFHVLPRTRNGVSAAVLVLGDGCAVIAPGLILLFDDRYQWLRPPTRRPEVNPLRPAALATVPVASAELLARIDRFGERYPTPYSSVAAFPDEVGR